ncbi:MAG: hypothetical protein ABR987_07430 [Terracidiphilus sp.]|jgi:hypothetical protein
MTDQNPQDARIEDTGQRDSLSAKVDESLQPSLGVVMDPDSQTTADEGADSVNRVYAYGGAIAVTLGILAGLAFASFAGRTSPRSGPANIGSTNSNAVVLAASTKAGTLPPADAITPPADLAAAQTPPDAQPAAASHRKAKKKAAVAPGAFAIEGDDELVGFDASKGVIQTSAKKFFLVSAIAGGETSAKWQDTPSNIHYKCDLNASCTLSRKGAAVLYAKLKN